MAETPREPDRYEDAVRAANRLADVLAWASVNVETSNLEAATELSEAVAGVRALASPAAETVRCMCPPGAVAGSCPLRNDVQSICECRCHAAPPSEPAAPEKDPYRVYEEDRAAYRVPEPAPLLPRILAALESTAPTAVRIQALAAELRAYIAEREGGAEAPDPERDRSRHNAMLVEAWRKEFAVLCETLFPGNDGPIGWKHVQAKVAALAARAATPSTPGDGSAQM